MSDIDVRNESLPATVRVFHLLKTQGAMTAAQIHAAAGVGLVYLRPMLCNQDCFEKAGKAGRCTLYAARVGHEVRRIGMRVMVCRMGAAA